MKFALFLAPLALAGAAMGQQTYDFKVVRKKGDIAKTKVTGRIDVQGMTILVNYVSVDEVLAVNPDGTLKVKNTASQASLTAGGVEQLQKDAKDDVSEVVLKPTGELIESTSPRMPITMQRRANRMTALMPPSAPVKVGETWSYKWADDEKLNTKAAEVSYTFLAVERVGAWDAAKVDFEFKEMGASQPMSSKGTLWLRTDTFEIVKSEYTTTNYRAPGVFVGLTVLMKTERQ